MISQIFNQTLDGRVSLRIVRYVSKRRQRINNWKRADNDGAFMSVFHLKKFDFGQENLQFPIHLPIARRRFFRVKRTHLQKNTRTEKNMSFAGMTGNQILLTLMDFQYLTQVELVEGFKALSNISQSSKIDWNEHEVVLDCLDKIYEIKDSLSFDSYLDLLIAFDKLDIQD